MDRVKYCVQKHFIVFVIVGIEPMDIFVSAEPCQLTLGIMSGCDLNGGYGILKRNISLEITDKLINENNLTALMVTHNMRDAIAHGNRLIMMNAGKIIIDVSGEEKKKLTVESLLAAFSKASGAEFASDRALLS